MERTGPLEDEGTTVGPCSLQYSHVHASHFRFCFQRPRTVVNFGTGLTAGRCAVHYYYVTTLVSDTAVNFTEDFRVGGRNPFFVSSMDVYDRRALIPATEDFIADLFRL